MKAVLPRRRAGRWLIGATAVTVAFILAGCSSTQPLPIAKVEVADGGMSLVVTVVTGPGDPKVTMGVEEEDTQVVLDAQGEVKDGDAQAIAELKEVTVDLDAALGSRELIDASTGKPVPSQ